MKKTTLFLLSSVSVLAACYSSPEMNENKYKQQYESSPTACSASGVTYQHAGLRRCMETRVAMEDANKKTVHIKEQKDGSTLVVPKTFDDENMMQENRVYEVVDVRSKDAIVIEEGTSPETTTTTTEITVEETKTSEGVTTEVSVTETVDTASTETDAQEVVEESVEGFEVVEAPATESEPVEAEQTETETIETEVDEPSVDANVEEVVEENTETETSEVSDEDTDAQTDEVSEGRAVQGVTLVVGPVKEELVISVKSADAQKTKTDVKKVKAGDKKIIRAEKIEEEVLPLEEK